MTNPAPQNISRCADDELKRRLRARALELGALKFGEFQLVSAAKTDLYFDGRLLSLDPQGAALIAEWLWRQIGARDDIDAVGGPAVAAIPMVGALVHRAALENSRLKGFFVRAAVKSHGTQNLIEGPIEPPMRLTAIEDAVTTGGSLISAIKALREHGYAVEFAAAIMDRGKDTQAKFAAIGVEFVAALTLKDLLSPT